MTKRTVVQLIPKQVVSVLRNTEARRLIAGGGFGGLNSLFSSAAKKPLIVLLNGQSNPQVETAYVWPVSSRLYIWDWNGTENGVGSNWVKHPGTWINGPIRMLSEIADRLGIDVYVFKLAWGGIPIEKYIYGVKLDWLTSTGVVDPGSGNCNVNNATVGSITRFMVSNTDQNAISRAFSWLLVASGHIIEVRNAAGVVKLTLPVSGAPVNHTTWWEFPIAGATGAGGILAGDDVRVLAPPNMQKIFDNNVPVGLAKIPGAPTRINMESFWQGESDTGAPTRWATDFEERMTIMRLKSWYPINTPIVMSLVSPSAINGDVAYDNINDQIQLAASADVDRRGVTNPGILPAALWDPVAFNWHLTGAGCDAYGKMAADNWLAGTGRNMLQGIVVSSAKGNIGIGQAPAAAAGTRISMSYHFNGATLVQLINVDPGASASSSLNLATNAGALAISALSTAGGAFGSIFWTGAGNFRLLATGAIRFLPGVADFGGVSAAGTWDFKGLVDISAAAAGQIKFPATQNPSADANTLDDYEEGTFTPTVIGSTVAGAGTYSVQTGTYTKIGNRVLYDISLTWSAHTGTGNMAVAGLPFTLGVNSTAVVYWESLTYTATPVAIVGGTQITLRNNASGAGPTDLPMDTAARLVISGQYRV